MSNERHNDFLQFALRRILESASFYESQAKCSKDQITKLYLFYLAAKKRVHYVQLEKCNAQFRISSPESETNHFTFTQIITESTELGNMSASEIHILLRKAAEQEFNLFIDLASFEEDVDTKKLLITLSKMAKDFIRDVSTGYALFTCRNKTLRIPTIPKRVMPILAQA